MQEKTAEPSSVTSVLAAAHLFNSAGVHGFHGKFLSFQEDTRIMTGQVNRGDPRGRQEFRIHHNQYLNVNDIDLTQLTIRFVTAPTQAPLPYFL